MITVMRSDDRLIHGQVQTQIIPLNGIKRVITIDTINASNAILKRVYEMSAPQGVESKVVTFQDSLELVKSAMNDDVKTLILARVPSVFADLYNSVEGLPKSLNIASVPAGAGRVKITEHCHLDEKEMNAVKDMDNKGVEIVFQLFPAKPGTSWSSIKSNY